MTKPYHPSRPETFISGRQNLLTTFFLGLFMVLVSPLVGQTTWYDKGREVEDNYRKVEYFTKCLETERQDAWVYYFRGWAYYGLGKYKTALRDFQNGVKAEGNLPKTYLYSAMAWCHYNESQYSEGLKAANDAIQDKSDNYEAWNVRGWLQFALEDPNAAIQSFTKYIELQPDKPLGYSSRSYVYEKTEQYEKAIADADKVLSMEPGNERVLERKAVSLMKLNRKDEAMTLIRDKIGYKKDDPKSLSNLGQLFYRNGDYQVAIDYHTRGIKLYEEKCREDRTYIDVYRDDIYEIYMDRGAAHYALDDKQRALADYKKATTIKPDAYNAWMEIGTLQTFQENWSEGAQAFERAFAINPKLKYGWVNLGFCYDNLGQVRKAIDAYSRGIANNPNVGLLYNNRGYGYLELKEYDKALADLEKAIEVEPDIVMSHVSLGEYYYARKMYDKAIAKFDHAIKMEEGSDKAYTAAYHQRGMCYFDQEMYDKAIPDFKAAIDLTPGHVDAYEKLGIAYFETDQKCESYKALRKALSLESNVADKQAKLAPRYLGKMTTNPCR